MTKHRILSLMSLINVQKPASPQSRLDFVYQGKWLHRLLTCNFNLTLIGEATIINIEIRE